MVYIFICSVVTLESVSIIKWVSSFLLQLASLHIWMSMSQNPLGSPSKRESLKQLALWPSSFRRYTDAGGFSVTSCLEGPCICLMANDRRMWVIARLILVYKWGIILLSASNCTNYTSKSFKHANSDPMLHVWWATQVKVSQAHDLCLYILALCVGMQHGNP